MILFKLLFLALFFWGLWTIMRYIYTYAMTHQDETIDAHASRRTAFGQSASEVHGEPYLDDLRELPFDSKTCESCSASPRIQFCHRATKHVLEFCGHHGRKNRDKLLESGFAVSIERK